MRRWLTACAAVAVLGGAGYVGWEVYQDSQERDADQGPNQTRLTPREAVEVFEQSPRWKGAGNPAFGVGENP